jgi:hypothetical protein
MCRYVVRQMFTDVSGERTASIFRSKSKQIKQPALISFRRLHVWLSIRTWRWKQYVPPKRLWTSAGLYVVTSQKITLSIYSISFLPTRNNVFYNLNTVKMINIVTCQRTARQRLDIHPAICARNNGTNVYSSLLENSQRANGLAR